MVNEFKENFKRTDDGIILNEWTIKKLGEVTEIINGGTPSRNVLGYWENGSILWATPTDVTRNNSKYLFDVREKITEKGLKNSSATLLPRGTVLMTSRATIGAKSIIKVPMATNQGFKSFICNNNVLYNEYLYYLIDILVPKLLSEASGSTFLEVSKNSVAQLSIALPPIKEQQKIATILSTVDKAIEKTEAIIEKTEQLKKGLMQQLLTKGVGHTKFKETKVGEIPVEWELLPVGSIAKLQGGYAFKSKDYIAEGIQLIRISNLFGKFLNLIKDPVYLPISYKEDCEGYVLNEGDLIICMTGTVGKEDYGHVVKIPRRSKSLLLNQRVGRFILQNQRVDRNFLYWFLSSRLFLDVIYSFGNGTKQANLSAKQIESVLIPLPPKEEQVKISRVLDSIDKKVKIEKEKLNQLEVIKKGLMQSLLTGKVRVTLV